MAIDPATLKVIAQTMAKIVTDKEKRNNIIYILWGSLAGLVVIIIIPIYLLTSPMEALKIVLSSNNNNQTKIEEFKTENDEKVLIMENNIVWNDGALYPMPISGTVTCDYGERSDPFGSGEIEFHNGIDIQGAWHCNIISIADGVIKKIDMTEGRGNSILIKHKDNDGKIFYSYYVHLSKIYVFEGQSIKQGAVIGLEGGDPLLDPNPGKSTGHHLHFEIREGKQNNRIDPAKFIFKIESEEENEQEKNN